MNIHQNGAKIFNKMFSFVVSIRVVALHFDHLIKRTPVIEVLGKSVKKELRYLTKHAVVKFA